MNLKDLWAKRPKWVNKYTVVLAAFAIYIAFFDDYSLLERFKLQRKKDNLKHETEIYDEQIAATEQKISDLNKNDSTLERYAREQYLMHADDEDVYLIEESE